MPLSFYSIMADQLLSSEQLKAEMTELLKKEGVEKIEKKDGVVYFHFTRPLFYDSDKSKLRIGNKQGDDLGKIGKMIIEYFGGQDIFFRSVDGKKDFQVLNNIETNGTEKESFEINKTQIYLSSNIIYASKYGAPEKKSNISWGRLGITPEGFIRNNRVIMLYKGGALRVLDPIVRDKYVFTQEPKTQLLGVLLLYCKREIKKGLITI